MIHNIGGNDHFGIIILIFIQKYIKMMKNKDFFLSP